MGVVASSLCDVGLDGCDSRALILCWDLICNAAVVNATPAVRTWKTVVFD